MSKKPTQSQSQPDTEMKPSPLNEIISKMIKAYERLPEDSSMEELLFEAGFLKPLLFNGAVTGVMVTSKTIKEFTDELSQETQQG